MSESEESFETEVLASCGVWPSAPVTWSYSSLKEAEICPRRWMLRRANYPEIWDQPGYPERLNVAAIVGDVIHRALELILRELASADCAGPTQPCFVEVLRALGGYTCVVERIIQSYEEVLASNPRVAHRAASILSKLHSRIPEMRQRIQAILSRGEVPAPIGSRPIGSGAGGAALALGSYAEVELEVPALSFRGRADLITLTEKDTRITDYKTGTPDESHLEQLQLYALLWSRDRSRNPSNGLVTELVVAYSQEDRVFEGLSIEELSSLERSLKERTDLAGAELGLRPPPARPSVDACSYCSVRHLCEEYWASTATAQDFRAAEFVDVEVRVVERSGPRSWRVVIEKGVKGLAETPALLRTIQESALSVGETLRVLDARLGTDDEAGIPILTMVAGSEQFQLRRAS